MLSRYDEYFVHQTPDPLSHPSTSDPNFYDRYFFNGFSRDGELFLGAALGLYPNRSVMDASLSVAFDGQQHSLHASRRAPSDRGETRVGPFRLEVLEPLHSVRVVAEPNETGLRCELVFRARTAAVEEEPMLLQRDGRVFMHSSRFTQFGSWEGFVEAEGRRLEIQPERVLGVRDRSWGVRPVGERVETGAPGPPPQFFWLWSPIHFEKRCTLLGVAEDEAGRRLHSNGALVRAHPRPADVPVADAGEVERMASLAHRVHWKKGTRRSTAAELELVPQGGEALRIELEPLLTFQLLGLGYTHFEWGHGMWKGEEALGGETWKLDALNPLDPRHFHVQQLCRARLGEEEGVGVLEQLAIGPHRPSGFAGLLDGAP